MGWHDLSKLPWKMAGWRPFWWKPAYSVRLGHDCFPCPANNSVIDFLRLPKPAYHALQGVYSNARFG